MFENIHAFYLFILLPVIVMILSVEIFRTRKLAKKICGDNVSTVMPYYTESQKWMRIFFYTIGMALAIIALARPRWGYEVIETTKKGRDIIIVLDTSYSMATSDVAPSRLDSAKRSITELLEMGTGDRVGLMVFSGECELIVPVTHDYAAVGFFLESIYPGMLAKSGTNIGAALNIAIDSFDDHEASNKMILLMTDGEDLEGPYYQMLKKAKESGIKIFTVGIGSSNGEPIPIRNSRGEIESYVKDESGKHVISRLNEKRLVEIAQTTGGSYLKSTNKKGELRRFIQSIDSIKSKEQEDVKYNQMIERYDIFLIPALICFAIGFILDQGRIFKKSKNRFGWLLNNSKMILLLCLVVSYLALSTFQGYAQNAPAEPDASSDGSTAILPKSNFTSINGGFWGNKEFNKQEYEKSIEKYTQAIGELKGNDLAKLYYNIANAYCQLQDYQNAAAYYENAAIFAKKSDTKAKIYYNQGCLAFKSKNYPAAAALFKQSLIENEDDTDARYNYQIAMELAKHSKNDQQDKQQQQQQESEAQEAQEQNQDTTQDDNQEMSEDDIKKMLESLDEKEKEENKDRTAKEKKNNKQKGKYW